MFYILELLLEQWKKPLDVVQGMLVHVKVLNACKLHNIGWLTE